MTQYYFDYVGGLDANSGLTTAAPKQTLAAIEPLIIAGNTISLKRGVRWPRVVAFGSNVTFDINGKALAGVCTLNDYGDAVNAPTIDNLEYDSGTGWTSLGSGRWSKAMTVQVTRIMFGSSYSALSTGGLARATSSATTAAQQWFWGSNVLHVYTGSDVTNPHAFYGGLAYVSFDTVLRFRDSANLLVERWRLFGGYTTVHFQAAGADVTDVMMTDCEIGYGMKGWAIQSDAGTKVNRRITLTRPVFNARTNATENTFGYTDSAAAGAPWGQCDGINISMNYDDIVVTDWTITGARHSGFNIYDNIGSLPGDVTCTAGAAYGSIDSRTLNYGRSFSIAGSIAAQNVKLSGAKSLGQVTRSQVAGTVVVSGCTWKEMQKATSVEGWENSSAIWFQNWLAGPGDSNMVDVTVQNCYIENCWHPAFAFFKSGVAAGTFDTNKVKIYNNTIVDVDHYNEPSTDGCYSTRRMTFSTWCGQAPPAQLIKNNNVITPSAGATHVRWDGSSYTINAFTGFTGNVENIEGYENRAGGDYHPTAAGGLKFAGVAGSAGALDTDGIAFNSTPSIAPTEYVEPPPPPPPLDPPPPPPPPSEPGVPSTLRGVQFIMVDRIVGVLGSTGIKAPVLVATTVAITLSGVQTIDGVAVAAGNRVLVKNQASSIANGIYEVSADAWSRTRDCDGGNDIAHGTLVHVTSGTGAGLYRCTGTEPIVVGTSAQAWSLLAVSASLGNPVPLTQGGTGGITAEAGLSALGVVQVNTEGGTANAQTGGVHALVTAYRADQLFVFVPSIANTGPTTLVLTPAGAAALPAKNIYMNGIALVGGELQIGVPVLLQYDGVQLNIVGRNPRNNLQGISLSVTVAANALTVAVKDEAGNDPTPGVPLRVPFRSATLDNGLKVVLEVVAAASVVVSSGSTLGTVNNGNHRLYVVGINDGGTFRVGIYNPLDANSGDLLGIDEAKLYTSTAEGGAGAADSDQVLYSTVGVAAKAVCLLGYFEISEATAGTWATAPTKVQVMGPRVFRTNDIVQETNVLNGTVATGTTTIPLDDTVPQVGEGNLYLTNVITPTSLCNHLRHRVDATFSHSAGTQLIMSMFRDGAANALAASVGICSTGASRYSMDHHEYISGVAATSYTMRAGSPTAGTTTFNGAGGAQYFATRLNSQYIITEIFA